MRFIWSALFNLYSEDIISRTIEAVEDHNIGIKINGTTINNLRYTDDTVFLTESVADLQILLDKVAENSN